MKYAVYVEGLAEMRFVADVLQKYSSYNPDLCGFICINLRADTFEAVGFPRQGDMNSRDYYQIVNVNNDNLVVSKLRKDISRLVKQDFNVIIGLRDVYGDIYKGLTNNQRVIDRALIDKMHAAQQASINDQSGAIRLHFAIMEYETWMLALIENFIVGKGKDVAALCTALRIDLSLDPEASVYHPFPVVKAIYQACGEDYQKHGKESFSFLNTLTVNDYERLRNSGRCASFAKLLDSLLAGTCPQLP